MHLYSQLGLHFVGTTSNEKVVEKLRPWHEYENQE
jgi:hypothetical protein